MDLDHVFGFLSSLLSRLRFLANEIHHHFVCIRLCPIRSVAEATLMKTEINVTIKEQI